MSVNEGSPEALGLSKEDLFNKITSVSVMVTTRIRISKPKKFLTKISEFNQRILEKTDK